MDLSAYEDESFDVTLLLGPMYHLYTEEDKKQALKEAVRVTRKGGHILVAYCMNESVIVQEEFKYGALKKDLAAHRLSEDFHCISKPEDLFVMVRIEEIYELTKELSVERIKTIATDGATNYMREIIDAFDQETFAQWLNYHWTTCERMDLIGATNHSLDILKKEALASK